MLIPTASIPSIRAVGVRVMRYGARTVQYDAAAVGDLVHVPEGGGPVEVVLPAHITDPTAITVMATPVLEGRGRVTAIWE